MAHSRFMQELIALRKLRDELENYVNQNLHLQKVKPLLRPLVESLRYKKI